MTVFDDKHRLAWLAFLNTDAGKAGLEKIRIQDRPSIRRAGDSHHIILDAGFGEGYDDALDRVAALGQKEKPTTFEVAESPNLEPTRRE